MIMGRLSRGTDLFTGQEFVIRLALLIGAAGYGVKGSELWHLIRQWGTKMIGQA